MPIEDPPKLEDMVALVHKLAQHTRNIKMTTHAKDQRKERSILRQQVKAVLRRGESLEEPAPPRGKHKYYTIKLRHTFEEREIQVVVAVVRKDTLVLVVTVISNP